MASSMCVLRIYGSAYHEDIEHFTEKLPSDTPSVGFSQHSTVPPSTILTESLQCIGDPEKKDFGLQISDSSGTTKTHHSTPPQTSAKLQTQCSLLDSSVRKRHLSLVCFQILAIMILHSHTSTFTLSSHQLSS
jgi:hypothetical protein